MSQITVEVLKYVEQRPIMAMVVAGAAGVAAEVADIEGERELDSGSL